jgi:NCS1 family nucleobase:cation symporter-1
VTVVAFWSFPANAETAGLYSGTFNGYYFAVIVALVFSYLMSWSPYASDYSRYLRGGTSRLKVAILVLVGGVVASLWVEFIGLAVYVDNPSTSGTSMIAGLAAVTGRYSSLALLAIVLGAVAANALNMYTNSLSALVVYGKSKRVNAVILAAVVGFLLALLGGTNFQLFYQDFLITLDYWITPWIGVMLVAFFLRSVKSGVEKPGGVAWRAVGSYAVGLVASVPFMNLTAYDIPFEGPIATFLQGADVSYFASFTIAVVAFLILTRRSPK